MNYRIALAGNPNCGKTTLFNALTGSNQFVGNWPGVTVEKKEGKLKKHDGVVITDLPGIYSLSPYTLEEVVARNYLVGERPDAILNLVDGTNLERNLYLTTQLTELGIPVVVAINMMDIVEKNGDKINIQELSRALGCKVVEISALKNKGVMEAAEAALEAAKSGKTVPMHTFSGPVEHALAHIEEVSVHDLPAEQQRWYAIKLFERDDKVMDQLKLSPEVLGHIESDISAAEKELDDDAESIITNERYIYIANVIKGCYKKKSAGKLTTSDKIDRVVTNRWLALPIFAVIMFLVYYISVSTVGTFVTDWTNDGLFGDGFFLFGKGSDAYAEAADEYAGANDIISAFVADAADKGIDVSAVEDALGAEEINADDVKSALVALDAQIADTDTVTWEVEDEETFETVEVSATGADLTAAIETAYGYGYNEPAPEDDYGWWIPGIPVLVGNGLDAINCADWLESLILDGIVGGVGAVLGFVPQMLVLFIMLAFLEACGYMSRIAFVLDRIFRRFGLSGKSFIPMLVGTGCGVPGIMASRTIENERDRRMTIMTTTFIPCGAKLPIIAMITAALFGGPKKGWWLAPVCYFIGIAAILVSGIILKKTKMFAGDPAPFVMELPAYHLPTVGNVLRSMWERGWSFIKKAGTIILLSTIIIWLGTVFGVANGSFGFYLELPEGGKSVLDIIGSAVSWIFAPLGFNDSTATVATIMGLVAKEEVVAVFGITDFTGLGKLAGMSFLVFNLLCAPCFAAMGAIRREMNNAKWTAFAIAYQCIFAYIVSLMIYQFGMLFTGNVNILGVIVAFVCLAAMVFMLVRPYKESTKLSKKLS
ncbi:MAG: ferrous iron transporter B [Clostridia bacterium]|nr:ferrous iron transporter B [Clostridia bacterium]